MITEAPPIAILLGVSLGFVGVTLATAMAASLLFPARAPAITETK